MTPVDVLPHRAPMLLLDRIVSHDATRLQAEIVIGEHTMFLEPDGVPAHIGLEYMAQACGAYAGALARQQGEPVKIGYLLGTRDFETSTDFFRPGQRLEVTAALLFRDGAMGAFECRIDVDGVTAATARLTVYQTGQEPSGA